MDADFDFCRGPTNTELSVSVWLLAAQEEELLKSSHLSSVWILSFPLDPRPRLVERLGSGQTVPGS